MGLGIYVHIPFCQTRCNYCGFVTRPWKRAIADRYCRAVAREIRAFSADRANDEVDSIYFGGGTPSILTAGQISSILFAVREKFPVAADCEISLEANPGSFDSARLQGYRACGVNRISLGAQTFDDDELVAIGRTHDGREIDRSVELVRACGMENVNLDLMIGLPGQTRPQWEANLKEVARLAPAHLSIYMLDLEGKSPLYHTLARGLYDLPDDGAVSDFYADAIDRLSALGYAQYEISNFALPGFRCRHNLKYWMRLPVLGFGVGSHSFDGANRSANTDNIALYLERVEADQQPLQWREPISDDSALAEALFLGLRLNQGVDWNQIRQDYSGSPKIESVRSSIRAMAEEGLLEWRDSRVQLTPRGRLLSNEVFQEFI